MVTYKAPVEDYQFLMHDVFDYAALQKLPCYEEMSLDLLDQILEEGGKFTSQELFPINQQGDRQGCKFKDGEVTTPDGFKEAYKAFTEAGWLGLSSDPQYGGQGIPKSINFMLEEFVNSSNPSFGLYVGLTLGAYRTILSYGSDALKELYLPKLANGIWSGTMCLTEPHCGTDLGLCKTKAERNDDGTYSVTGTKIFITSGEHDLTENIIHLVLAKIPGGPEGSKGLSLFLVPKFLPNAQGEKGERNSLACASIEDKMGIKASSTCVMNFDGAKGWLVGGEHQGIEAMFVMMNIERLSVGLQGLGAAEVAYQSAVEYAKERLQGRSLKGPIAPNKPADPIICHPDVRKNLLTIRSFAEGARALSAWVGLHIDHKMKNPDPKKAREASDLVDLMTPIIKAFMTDLGYEGANIGMQVFGGHGYIKEYGMEQIVRDARISQIYEGTNGIQAMDLIGRKVGQSMGRLLRSYFHPVGAYIEAKQSDELLAPYLMPYLKMHSKLQQATAILAQKSMKNPEEAGAAATDYLALFGYTVLGYMWLLMIEASYKGIKEKPEKKRFYQTKIKTGRFYFERLMPRGNAHYQMLMAGAESIMAHEMDEF